MWKKKLILSGRKWKTSAQEHERYQTIQHRARAKSIGKRSKNTPSNLSSCPFTGSSSGNLRSLPYIYIYINNVGYRLVSWDPIVRNFPNIIWYPVKGGWASIVSFFSEIHFFQESTKPFIHLSLMRAGRFTYLKKTHVCFEHLKMQDFPPKKWCLIEPLLKNNAQTIFQGSTPWVTQILNNVIVWMVLYCGHKLLGVKKNWGLNGKIWKINWP